MWYDKKYIGSHYTLQVTSSGIIVTVAGTNDSGYSGDGGAGTGAALSYPMSVAVSSNGNVYVADTPNFVVRMVRTYAICVDDFDMISFCSFLL